LKNTKNTLKPTLEILFFVGKQLNIIPKETDFKGFKNLDFKVKFKCRVAMYKNDHLLEKYLELNLSSLTNAQSQILEGFKKRITSDFVILKCLANEAIFIDSKDNKFYAVKALSNPFNLFFDEFPVIISTTIIPFKGKIIYDGFF